MRTETESRMRGDEEIEWEYKTGPAKHGWPSIFVEISRRYTKETIWLSWDLLKYIVENAP